MIESIKFIPIHQKPGSPIGFVSFIYNGLLLRDVALYRKINGKGYKCVYPENKVVKRAFISPKNAEVQNKIDETITKYIDNIGGVDVSRTRNM